MVNILILGSGGREKVLGELLGANQRGLGGVPPNNHIYEYSGNNFLEIKEFCIINQISLVIPSTETYLCEGIVDYLQQELNNIMVFGPTKEQAEIEGSKFFSKTLMKKLNIPTSDFNFYKDLDIIQKALRETYTNHKNIVIKYSGLASGKGVYLPEDNIESEAIVKTLYENNMNKWNGIIIEDRLIGSEVSVMGFCNGKETFLMPQAQDYKRLNDGDLGPNTGGMGAVCPVNILTDIELDEVKKHMNKVVETMNYKGVLYAGILKTNDGVFFLEFNCRFGDPEAQVILNLLNSDLYNILNDCINERTPNIKWKDDYAANVVLSHKDYPKGKLNVPVEIQTKPIDDNIKIYESNITTLDHKKYTYGGRVMSLVSVDNSAKKALENIYNNINKIKYDGMFYRKDIGSNI